MAQSKAFLLTYEILLTNIIIILTKKKGEFCVVPSCGGVGGRTGREGCWLSRGQERQQSSIPVDSRTTKMAGRRFTRPRTRVYDYNYNLGENYYRSALDGLDRKYGTLPAETIEPPKRPERPLSMGNIDSLIEERNLDAQALGREMEEEMQSMSRISRARAREAPTAEAEFENAFHSRREEVKKRFSEKMLDAVGINGTALEEESASIKQRRARRLMEAEEKPIRPAVAKWTVLTKHPEDEIDEWASKARARASRARLADIENEMEEISARGAQRERRLAGLRELLGESSQDVQSSSSVRLRKTVVTTSTESRLN